MVPASPVPYPRPTLEMNNSSQKRSKVPHCHLCPNHNSAREFSRRCYGTLRWGLAAGPSSSSSSSSTGMWQVGGGQLGGHRNADVGGRRGRNPLGHLLGVRWGGSAGNRPPRLQGGTVLVGTGTGTLGTGTRTSGSVTGTRTGMGTLHRVPPVVMAPTRASGGHNWGGHKSEPV